MTAIRGEALVQRHVDRIRSFERLFEHALLKARRAAANEDFTVADTRVIHELGLGKEAISGAWLGERLDLDTGYLCRILKKLAAFGLVTSRASNSDRRMLEWELTNQGRSFAGRIEGEYRERVRVALYNLQAEEQQRLVDAMATIEHVLRREEIVNAARGWPSPRLRSGRSL